MNEYVVAVMGLLGGLGVLLFGFKVLSDAIEKLANDKLRSWFGRTSGSGRLAGLGIGLVTTSIIQSSSATTVMTVGFVNAGVMSLAMATAVIMGANIGTTVTAQIAALNAFSFSSFVLPLAFIGIFITMLTKSDKAHTIGYILGGLGLVFVGLEFMSSSMEVFRTSEAFRDLLTSISNPLLLLFIGIAFTAIIQSSSAVTTIIIAMVGAGLSIGSGGNSVLFIVLGSNIGTCVTALLSSIGANTNAKRAALIHLMFNVFGTILFTIMLLLWPSFNDMTFMAWFDEPETQIAMFHTFFNVVCVILFFPFISVFVKIATFLIHDKKEHADAEQASTFLDDRLLMTPSIAVLQARKEVARVAAFAMDTLTDSVQAFIAKDMHATDDIRNKIQKTNDDARRIIKFLIKLSGNDISYKDEKVVSKLHESIGDIVRISDLADNMTKYTAHYAQDGLEFSDAVISDIKLMLEKTNQLFAESLLAFNGTDIAATVRADELEDQIDSLKKHIVDGHIKRLNEGKCQPQSSSVLINLVGNMERAADHILNLSHAFDKV